MMAGFKLSLKIQGWLARCGRCSRLGSLRSLYFVVVADMKIKQNKANLWESHWSL